MWNFQTPLLTEEHMSLLKGSGTSVMETFSLELHHNIMLANKCCLYCKPVVAPMWFSLGRNCACVCLHECACAHSKHTKSQREQYPTIQMGKDYSLL